MECNYVSEFYVLSSLHDIKIGFAAVEPELDDSGNVVSENKVNNQRITMSPALAKDLAEKLNRVVVEYEKCYGKIPEVMTVGKE